MTHDHRDPPITEPSASEPNRSERDGALRRRAESRTGEDVDPWGAGGAPMSVDEAQKVLHNLKVHQIELELQNDELRRVQAELAASRRRYFELYDMAPVAYLTINEAGFVLEANLACVPLLGVERSPIAGRPFTQFIRPSSQDAYYRHRNTVVEAAEAQTCELDMQRADGSGFVGRVTSTPATGPTGERVSRVVVSDVTQRKAEEDQRLKLEQRLQQAEKAESLGRMAGSISHHFNNLLTVVIGNLELARSERPTPAEPDDALADALAAARSAAKLSTTLLGYLGQTRKEQGPQDLSDIVRQSLPMLRAAMPVGTELDSDLPSSGLTVRANVEQISHVLQNLVTNAWEAALPGRGLIRIFVREVHRNEVPTTECFPPGWSPRQERYAVVSVTDRGPGIDQRTVEQIFDPFFSDKQYGRGLGLSVALGSVKAHDGAICVVHPPEGGTTMEVYLPLSDQEAPTAVLPPVARAPRTQRGLVLLVDDEGMLRSVGARMISRLGYEVVTAGDGIEALEVFDEHADRIACVVCDLTMPGMNGWATLEALRQRCPGLPVVLTSGFDETHARAGDHAEQPQVFMSKPWSQAGFKSSIERAIG